MAGSKVGLALGGIVALAGIAGGALWWQGASEQEAAVTRLLDAARSELGREPVDREGARAVARQLEQLREAGDGRVELLVAQGDLLIAADDANGAWDVLKAPVSLPGAAPELQDVAGRALQEVAGRTGSLDQFRQAATLSASYARASDSANALLRAFLLAFRAGDPGLLADYGGELLERHPGTAEAKAVEALGADLAGWVADRSGLDRDALDADGSGDAGALGRLTKAAGAPGSGTEVDALRVQLGEAPPEVLLVLAARTVSRVGESRDDAAQGALFDALDQLGAVLELQPASLEARHVAAVVYFGLLQARGGALEPQDLARLRGYLDWLLRNAPERDVRRETWRQLRDVVPK